MVVDGITVLDSVVGKKSLGTPLQRCVTHLKRNVFAKTRHDDKAALAENLRDKGVVAFLWTCLRRRFLGVRAKSKVSQS